MLIYYIALQFLQDPTTIKSFIKIMAQNQNVDINLSILHPKKIVHNVNEAIQRSIVM